MLDKKRLMKKLKHHLHTVEIWVDKSILPAVLVLMVILILELGFPEVAHHYEHEIHIADFFVILVFVLDLIFKYNHVRNIPKFLKQFWLDILAVFPFFLIFRAIEGVSSVIYVGETGQQLLHEGLELEKEGSRLAKEGEKLTKLNKEVSKGAKFFRLSRLARFVKISARLIRVLKLIPHFSRRHKRIMWEKETLKKKQMLKDDINKDKSKSKKSTKKKTSKKSGHAKKSKNKKIKNKRKAQ